MYTKTSIPKANSIITKTSYLVKGEIGIQFITG